MPSDASTSRTTEGTVTIFQSSTIPQFVPQNEPWSLWKEKLEIHFCEIGCAEENKKKAILLKSIGSTPYAVLHSLCSPVSPVDKSYKEVCQILQSQYTPPVIVFKERKAFHMSAMKGEESVSDWFARVKQLSLNCHFGEQLEHFVLNQFVMGLTDRLFERMCEEDEKITIETAVRKALIWETTFTLNNEQHVNLIKNNNQHNKYKKSTLRKNNNVNMNHNNNNNNNNKNYTKRDNNNMPADKQNKT